MCVYIYIYICKISSKKLGPWTCNLPEIFFFLFFFNKDYIFLRRHVRV